MSFVTVAVQVAITFAIIAAVMVAIEALRRRGYDVVGAPARLISQRDAAGAPLATSGG